MTLKLVGLVALLCLAGSAGAGGVAASSPLSGPDVNAPPILRFLQFARGYGTCAIRCDDRYRACLARAAAPEARRACRLARSLCEADCNRYIGR